MSFDSNWEPEEKNKSSSVSESTTLKSRYTGGRVARQSILSLFFFEQLKNNNAEIARDVGTNFIVFKIKSVNAKSFKKDEKTNNSLFG